MPPELQSAWLDLLDAIRSQPQDEAQRRLDGFQFGSLTPEHAYFAHALYHRIHSGLTQAEPAIARALEAAAIRDNKAVYSDCLLLQSYVNYAKFDSPAASEALRRARQIKSELGDPTGEIKILCNLANLAISQQRLSEAREAHRQARQIFDALAESHKDPLLDLYLANVDGLIFEQLGDYQAAAEAYCYGWTLAQEQQLIGMEISFGLNYFEALAHLPQQVVGDLPQRFQTFLSSRHPHDAFEQSVVPARIHRALGDVAAARTHALAVAQRAHDQGNASLRLEAMIEVVRASDSSLVLDAEPLLQALSLAQDSQRLSEALTILQYIVKDERFSETERLRTYYPALVDLQQRIFDSVRDQTLQNLSRKAGIENAQRLAQYEQQLRVQAEKTIQRQLEELERGRLFDALTGLPNRVMLLAQVSQQVQGTTEPFALLTMDLNRFQLINDAYGHALADDVLRVTAQRLQAQLRPGELVARVGGDEFALLLRSTVDLQERGAALAATLAQPIELAGQTVRVSASVGGARWPLDAGNAESLRRAAELALLDAKARGETLALFDAQSHTHVGLEGDLARALSRGEYELHFQPQVDIQARRVVSTEALLRWNSREHGLQFPGTFMPILERGDHIVEVGAWVLREACRRAQPWGDVRVAVNLSARQFSSPDLVETVRSALRESGLAPHRLELEITESLMMLNPDRTARVLEELRSDGVHVMLDDFGTGYSSLAYLSRFPLSGLKVDRSFVQQMMTEPRGPSAAIVRAMVSLSRDLGLELVAEGVETRGDVETLRAEGICVMQGYYFARPTRDWEPLDLTLTTTDIG